MNKQRISFIFVLLLCNSCALFGAKIDQKEDALPTQKEIDDFFNVITNGDLRMPDKKNKNFEKFNLLKNAKKDYKAGASEQQRPSSNSPYFIIKDVPAITYAIIRSKHSIAQKLLDWGADPKIQDGNGKLPQDYLREPIKEIDRYLVHNPKEVSTICNIDFGQIKNNATKKRKDLKFLWNFIGMEIGRNQISLNLELGELVGENALNNNLEWCKSYKGPLTGNNLLHDAILGGNEENVKRIIEISPDLIEQTNNKKQKPIDLTQRSYIKHLLRPT